MTEGPPIANMDQLLAIWMQLDRNESMALNANIPWEIFGRMVECCMRRKWTFEIEYDPLFPKTKDDGYNPFTCYIQAPISGKDHSRTFQIDCKEDLPFNFGTLYIAFLKEHLADIT